MADHQELSSKINEPPPPYPGRTGSPVPYPLLPSEGAGRYPQAPPPPYPGDGPPAYATDQLTGVNQPQCYGGFPYEFPESATTITTVTIPRGDCPRCGIGRMDDRPDIALIICLILMAFLFTPLTLCCIPCAFHRTCPNCGYQAA